MDHTLKIVSLNANGLKAKSRLPVVADLLRTHNIDILLVQETRLKANMRASIVGYHHYRIDSSPGIRGLSTFIKHGLTHAQHLPLNNSDVETQATEVTLADEQLIIFNAYKSPSNDHLDTSDIDRMLAAGRAVIVVGDLNCKHTAWDCRYNNKAGKQLYNHYRQRSYQIVAPDEPTRTDPRDAGTSTLDIALTQGVRHLVTAETLDCVGSDHNPVLFTVHATPRHSPAPPRHNYNRARWPSFQSQLQRGLTIQRFNSEQEIDEGVATLTCAIQEAMEDNIPKTNTLRRPDELPPDLKDKKRQKNAAKRRWCRTRQPAARDAYNYLRHCFDRDIAAWRDKQWQGTMEKCNKDHTQVWRLGKALKGGAGGVQPLTIPAGTAITAAEKAEAISSHFEAVHKTNDHMAETHHTQQVERDLAAYMERNEDQNTPTRLATPREVHGIIKSMRPRKAPGEDGIQNIVLQQLPRKAIVYLTMLINACLILCYFPKEWKRANVLPFPKAKKDHKLPQNYRPISLLCALSKVLERVLNSRMTAYLRAEDLLLYEQFGFRAKHSTTDQITRLTEYITEGFNLDMHTGAVLLDASFAFDTVWTTGLLYKMSQLSFSKELINILKSYLTGRTFYVTVDGVRSRICTVANGTPQGSILGPILFIIYMNDIPRPLRGNIGLFADDTAPYYRHKEIPTLVCHLQRALEDLLLFFRRWRLKINAQKTEPILFSRRNTAALADHKIRIDGAPLDWKQQARFLGVHLDKRLNLKAHLQHVKRCARGATAIIYPLINKRSQLSTPLKVQLANAYIRPILTYAAPAWAGLLSDSDLRELQCVQNKYLRLATGCPRRTSLTELHRLAQTPRLGDFIVDSLDKYYARTTMNENPLIAALGQYTPETAHYRMKHKMPKHRLFTRDQ